MPRTARLVVPGYPHHVTQRGIRGLRTFFGEADYALYLALLKDALSSSDMRIWAYCLMPNHVHFVCVPTREASLATLFRHLHSTYAKTINAQHGWKGHLWQERFYSAVMDEPHTIAALRYVELNPVRANLCVLPQDWRWSSANSNIRRHSDGIVDTSVTAEIAENWHDFLAIEPPEGLHDSLRNHTRTGRPAGDARFVDTLEAITGRSIRRRKPGPAKTS